MNQPLFLGVDIGTTTLSFSIAGSTGVVHTHTLPNDAALPASPGMQDAQRIAALALDTAGALRQAYPAIAAVGVTGQMHGVVCLNEAGEPVSPLYTWQCPLADDACCEEIYRQTGLRVHSGYGYATLYALAQSGGLPQRARTCCTIMDYIVMRMTGRTQPLMHATNAASLGLYRMDSAFFDADALHALGLGSLVLPEVICDNRIAGLWGRIPVSVAIGDNQASFFGSVPDEAECALVNYGTGSQLSMVTSAMDAPPSSEVRPYLGGQYLLCRSALCGGRAYAMLEQFFAAYARQAGFACDHYAVMGTLAEQALREGAVLPVCTRFCGTREYPSLRGSITQLGEENFTPGALALGVLQGMVDELHEGMKDFPPAVQLIASGNAVQKNPVLRTLLESTFAMPLRLSASCEEAAFGAALFGGLCAGRITYAQAKDMVCCL